MFLVEHGPKHRSLEPADQRGVPLAIQIAGDAEQARGGALAPGDVPWGGEIGRVEHGAVMGGQVGQQVGDVAAAVVARDLAAEAVGQVAEAAIRAAGDAVDDVGLQALAVGPCVLLLVADAAEDALAHRRVEARLVQPLPVLDQPLLDARIPLLLGPARGHDALSSTCHSSSSAPKRTWATTVRFRPRWVQALRYWIDAAPG